MAESPENNRRPLPRVNNNGMREANQRAQGTERQVQNISADVNNLKNDARVTTQSINELKDKFAKTESKVRKNEQDIAKVDQKAQMADNNAINAQRSAVQNSKDLRSLQKSTLSAIQNAVGGFQSSLNGNLVGVNASVSNINEVLSSTSSSFNLNKEQTEARLANVEQEIQTFGLELQSVTSKIEESSNELILLNERQDEATENLTYVVEEIKTDQLLREKEAEKNLRLTTADKRREIKENILEGASRAIRSTGAALSKTTNSLLGGFNLINAVKSLLGSLALGLTIIKFPEIYNSLKNNVDNLRRIGAIISKSFLAPAKVFFKTIISVAGTLITWTYKGFRLISELFGKFIRFGANIGKKVIDGIASFIGKLIKLGKKVGLFQKAGSVASRSAANSAVGSASNAAGEAASNGNFFTRLVRQGQSIASGVGNAVAGGARTVDSSLFGGAIGRTGKISLQWLKDQAKPLLTQFNGFFAPIKSAITSFKSGAESAIKEGPAAFKNFFARNIDKVMNLLGPVLDAAGPTLRRLAPILGGIGGFLGTGAGRVIKSLAGANSLVNFPVDFLVNKFIMGHGDQEAAVRATGSTLGSGIGNALGVAAGALTGPGAVAASPILGGLGGIVGGEFGDFLTARMFYPGRKDTTFDMVGDAATWLNNWLSGGTSSESGGESTSASGLGKLSLGSSSGRSAIPSSGMQPSASISSSNGSHSSAMVPVSQYLRKPSEKKPSSPTGSSSPSGSGSSVAQMTLPAKVMDMPTQVIGDPGESLDTKPAQNIPNISPSNPSMDYLQLAAANAFGMQLV